MDIPELNPGIKHQESILMMGSCFTTNMGKKLQDLFFSCTTNPTGILFDPLSLARHLAYLLDNKVVASHELNKLDELYTHWDFHGSFSQLNENDTLAGIQAGIERGKDCLKNADWLFLTFGTAQVFSLKYENRPVSNCHRFPSNMFTKRMIDVNEAENVLEQVFNKLHALNSDLKIVLTVSPVRHAKDGILNNSRSKARLIELCYRLESQNGVHYFPSYELQMDVLRDYRFYDADLVHPNYAATQYIFERFCKACLSKEAQEGIPDLQRLADSLKHRSRYPESKAHQNFLEQLEDRKQAMLARMPWLKKNSEFSDL